jgi:hypothetical protein
MKKLTAFVMTILLAASFAWAQGASILSRAQANKSPASASRSKCVTTNSKLGSNQHACFPPVGTAQTVGSSASQHACFPPVGTAQTAGSSASQHACFPPVGTAQTAGSSASHLSPGAARGFNPQPHPPVRTQKHVDANATKSQ